MSEDNSSPSETPKSGLGRMAKMALLSGVLGISVGAGLYAFYGQYGNGESQLAAAGGTECAVDNALVKQLNAAAGGEVAAFTALDRPMSVADLGFKDRDGAERTLGDWSGKNRPIQPLGNLVRTLPGRNARSGSSAGRSWRAAI